MVVATIFFPSGYRFGDCVHGSLLRAALGEIIPNGTKLRRNVFRGNSLSPKPNRSKPHQFIK